MRSFLVLSRVQLRAMLAGLRIGGSRKKAASGWTALLLAAALCLYVSGAYSFALAGPLAQAGALHLLLILMPGMGVAAGVIFTAFAAQGVVFSGRDADLLLSMPVPALTVLLSKLTALYGENLLFCTFLVLPAGAAWLWQGGDGGALFLLRLLLGTLFLTLLPTALSLAAGFLLSWLAGRFGNRRAVNLLLYALLLVAVFFLAFQINGAVSALAAGTVAVPLWAAPFQLFQQGVCGNWETLVMFCLLSLALLLLAAALLARSYQQVLTGLHAHRRAPAYRLAGLSASSQRQALLRKEAARFFGTPVYLFNAGLGLLLLPIAGFAAALLRSRIQEMLAPLGRLPLLSLAAAAVVFALSTVAVTGSSISLEGKNLWILKESPISASRILGTKALFQFLLTVPSLLIGGLGLAWGLKLSWPETVLLLLLGAIFSAFTALLGLAVNLLFPKLDAISDMAVVKQSAASMLAAFGGMGAAALCALLAWSLTDWLGEFFALALCGAPLLPGCAVLARWLCTRGAARFQELI